jgi:adenosylmethionine-8-amino-7-oxononanoate aminotransferase
MNENDKGIGPQPAETVETLRARHQPPGGEGYWEALQAGIMARIADADSAWWTVLNRWSRPGLAAAVLVTLIATIAMLAVLTPTPAVAYDEVLEGQTPSQVRTVLAANPGTAREATLRYVLSH